MTAECLCHQHRKRVSLPSLGIRAPNAPEVGAIGLASESRKVRHGDLFFALPGARVHGASFVRQAALNGATAIVTDAEGNNIATSLEPDLDIPIIVMETPRLALAKAAARWFDDMPENITAVTGTNGKTSVASMCRQIWQSQGHTAANCGTTGIGGDFWAPVGLTTPDPITLHRAISEMKLAGVTHLSLEASSHGLKQYRLDGVPLQAAAFTNLSQDHLDYHADLEDYFQSKQILFDRILPNVGTAVICIGDEWGRRLSTEIMERGQNLLTVGKAGSDLEIVSHRFSSTGQDLRFAWRGKTFETQLQLVGGFQAWNVLCAAGLAIATGEEPDAVFGSLDKISTVRGRMDLVARRDNGAPVFVDYAHTPDALKNALLALRQHCMGRILIVFGAGGDRDRTKRREMGKAASEFADLAFVTDDNPRTEIASEIRAAIIEGCPRGVEVSDRAEAILHAVDALSPGDGLLIAGKGHETGQVIGDTVYPFDDTEQASIAVQVLDGREC